jgi:hypothetical protein
MFYTGAENTMKKALAFGVFCGFFALVFTACEFNVPIKEDIDYYLHFTPVTTWAEIQAIIDKTPEGGKVNIGLVNDISAGALSITIPAGKTVTIEAHKGDYTITRTSSSVPLFKVDGGAFTLGDFKSGHLTLDGNGSSITASNAMVQVTSGDFILDGATISGNTLASGVTSTGAGVYIGNNSSFTMYGGDISGNNASAANFSVGGVYVSSNGSFTMHGGRIGPNNSGTHGGGIHIHGGKLDIYGGEISGNTATGNGVNSGNGGGVYAENTVTFTMRGGKISGNTATGTYTNNGNGGGVYVSASTSGSFTIYDGEISGNTATSTGTGGNGGGVYATSTVTFKKEPASGSSTSGTIYGNNATGSDKNTAASDSKGHAVYVSGTQKRNNTAGPSITLDSATAYPGGGWE